MLRTHNNYVRMKIHTKSLKLFIIGILLYLPNVSLGDAVARYGGEFLAAGAGARSLAMGGAYSSQGGGVWSLFWNPAGLHSITSTEVGMMHSERFAGVVDYSAGAIVMPQPDNSTLALGFIRLGVNGIPFTRLEDPNAPLSEQNRVEITKMVNEGEYGFFAAKTGQLSKLQWGIAPQTDF